MGYHTVEHIRYEKNKQRILEITDQLGFERKSVDIKPKDYKHCDIKFNLRKSPDYYRNNENSIVIDLKEKALENDICLHPDGEDFVNVVEYVNINNKGAFKLLGYGPEYTLEKSTMVRLCNECMIAEPLD